MIITKVSTAIYAILVGMSRVRIASHYARTGNYAAARKIMLQQQA